MRQRSRRRRDGFTLIEILVVMAIMAALMAVAFPQFVTLYKQVRMSYERSDLERQLLALPQKVREEGRAGVLLDPSDAPPRGTGTGREASAPAAGDWQILHIHVPEGWRMRVPKPIHYHFTGACDGGQVIFLLPPLSLRYVLTAPLCRPRMIDATNP